MSFDRIGFNNFNYAYPAPSAPVSTPVKEIKPQTVNDKSEQQMSTGTKLTIAAGIILAVAAIVERKNIAKFFRGEKPKIETKDTPRKQEPAAAPEPKPEPESPKTQQEKEPKAIFDDNPFDPIADYRTSFNNASTKSELSTLNNSLQYDIKNTTDKKTLAQLYDLKAKVLLKMKNEQGYVVNLESKLNCLEPGSKEYVETQNKIRPVKEKIAALKQIEFEKVTTASTDFYNAHEKEIAQTLLDKNGKLSYADTEGVRYASFDELVRPYDGELGVIYHGTTPESYEKILQEGFRTDLCPKNGHLDAIGGVYFTTGNNNSYGSNIVKARFKGKAGVANTDVLNSIKVNTPNRMNVTKLIKKYGMDTDLVDSETIIRLYLQKQFQQRGYNALLGNNVSGAAGVRYLSVQDPKMIEIIRP